MADEENILLNGKTISSFRVVDLKKECDKRGLSKSGSKVQLIDRLKAQLLLEQLQSQPVSDSDEAPNIKLKEDEKTGKSEFIKQYLERQQKILVVEREARKRFSEEESESSQDEKTIDSPRKASENPGKVDKISRNDSASGESHQQTESRKTTSQGSDEIGSGDRSSRKMKRLSQEETPVENAEEMKPPRKTRRWRKDVSEVKDGETTADMPEEEVKSTRISRSRRSTDQEDELPSTRPTRTRRSTDQEEDEVHDRTENKKPQPEQMEVEAAPENQTSTENNSATVQGKLAMGDSSTVQDKPAMGDSSTVLSKQAMGDSSTVEGKPTVGDSSTVQGKPEDRTSSKEVPMTVDENSAPTAVQGDKPSDEEKHKNCDVNQDKNRSVSEDKEPAVEQTHQEKEADKSVNGGATDLVHETNQRKNKPQSTEIDSSRNEESRGRKPRRSRSSSSSSSASSSSRSRSRSKSSSSSRSMSHSKDAGKTSKRRKSSSSSSSRSRSPKAKSRSPRPKSRPPKASPRSPRPKSSSRSRSRTPVKVSNRKSRSPSSSQSRSRSRSVSKGKSRSPASSRSSSRSRSPVKKKRKSPSKSPVRVNENSEPNKEDTHVGKHEREDKKSKEMPMEVQETTQPEKDHCNEQTARDSSPRAAVIGPRKVSLTGRDKEEEKGEDENKEKPVRKRKWGSSRTATTAQPVKRVSSINISTDSLKGLIPEIKLTEPVLNLDHEDEKISDQEEDKRDVKLRRTVVVKDDEERGEEKKEETGDKGEEAEVDGDRSDEEAENKPPTPKKEVKTQDFTETTVIRRVSQHTAIEADEPITAPRSPSPARNPLSNIIHIRNLVRPFTLNQLKELAGRTGTMVDSEFWIDKIKSHCFVTYETQDQAVDTRKALHGTKWPSSNPKVLKVEFATADDISHYRDKELGPKGVKRQIQQDVKPKPPEKREREREPRKKEEPKPPPPIREWDRDKIRQSRERESSPRNRSRSDDRRQRDRSRDRERDRRDRRGPVTEKAEDEPPAKLLDDLFKKTKATPCIYWLPLTEAQYIQKEKERKERQVARERIRQGDEQDRRKSSPQRSSPVRRRGDSRDRGSQRRPERGGRGGRSNSPGYGRRRR